MDRERLKTVSGIALPIIGGMVSQNVMNLVDTAMVGSLGKEALAGVGMASFATFLSQAFLTGLSSGVQAMAARRKGEKKIGEMAVPLNGGLVLAIVLGVPLSALLFAFSSELFGLLNDDPAVVAVGASYWRIRLIAVSSVAMNYCFRGYFNGVGRSKLYLRTLLIMHASNLILNYTLIYGKFGAPALGADGAAYGTTISTFLGTATYFSLGMLHARGAGFLAGLPKFVTFRTMLRLSVPSGLQQLFFAGGMTTLFVIVGEVGTTELAAANVLLNLTLVGVLPGIGLGLAAASLVGQALGREEPEDARRWGWDVVKIGMIITSVIGLAFVIAPELLLSIFIHNDPETIAVGVWPLRIAGLTLPLEAVGMVLMNALLGAGYTVRVAGISIAFQWLIFLPAAYVIGPVMMYGLVGIWFAQAMYRVMLSGIFASMWQRDGWTRTKV